MALQFVGLFPISKVSGRVTQTSQDIKGHPTLCVGRIKLAKDSPLVLPPNPLQPPPGH